MIPSGLDTGDWISLIVWALGIAYLAGGLGRNIKGLTKAVDKLGDKLEHHDARIARLEGVHEALHGRGPTDRRPDQ